MATLKERRESDRKRMQAWRERKAQEGKKPECNHFQGGTRKAIGRKGKDR